MNALIMMSVNRRVRLSHKQLHITVFRFLRNTVAYAFAIHALAFNILQDKRLL